MADENGDDGLRQAAVFTNTFKALHPWIQSTGFRTHPLRYRTFGHAREARVAEDFLLNTRFLRHERETELSIQSYFTDRGVVMLSALGREEPAGPVERELPQGARLRRDLGETIASRRSTRAYTGDAIPLDYLASIVRSAAAVTHEATVPLATGQEATLRFRTVPSGGGLYPIDLYVVAAKVRGLDTGVYRYDPLADSLQTTGEADRVERLLGCFAVPEEVIALTRASAVLLMVARPWRSMRKYGPRGLRFVFIEAGAIAQNVHLATEALGYGSVDCASFVDDEVHEAMGLDGLYQSVVHSVVIGYPG